MTTVIVTGGAGFIGSNFVRYVMAHRDWKVVVADKLTYAGSLLNLEGLSNQAHFHFEKVDITDGPAIAAIFGKYKPRALLNFAAESHVDRSIDGPAAFVQTNVVGTFVLLEAALQYYRALSKEPQKHFRFLHISTDEVYGSLGPKGCFKETTPYAPNSPYSASKASADHFVRAYEATYHLPTLITNCSNNYGPYQFPEKLIPLMILNAIEGKKLPIYGDGGNIRDWIYVEDHCAGILRVLEKGRLGEKYNLGGNQECTNLQIVDKICAHLEKLRPAERSPKLKAKGIPRYQDLKTLVADRPGHDRRYAIDTAKIRRELGWKPKHNFDQGLKQTIRWYLEHQDWCRKVQEDNYNRERLGLKP